MKKPIILFVNPLHPQQNTIDFSIYTAKKLQSPLLLYSGAYTPVPVHPHTTTGQPIAAIKTTAIEEEGELALQHLCQQVQKLWPETKYEYESGYAANSPLNRSHWMLQKVNEQDPSLVIIGKEHDYFWWNRVVNTAETRLAKSAPCPVLMIPQDVRLTEIERILYVANEEELHLKNHANLVRLSEFGVRFKSEIKFLYFSNHVSDLGENLEHFKTRIQQFAPFQTQLYQKLTDNASTEDILTYATASPANIMAFSYQEESYFQRLFGNDDSRQLVLKANLPILVF